MPNLVTHYLHGEQVINANHSILKNQILDNYQEFAIGTSGPDLFFYYNIYPWLNRNAATYVNEIGSIIHKEKINDFFKSVLRNAKDNDDYKINSYVSGLLCHWALDSRCHPFIFYFSNCEDKKLSTLYHRQFETSLDSIMLQRIKKEKAIGFKPYLIASYNEESIDAIYSAYDEALYRVHNINLEREVIKKSMQSFYSIQKFMYDKSGNKKVMTYNLESLIQKPLYASSMMMSFDFNDYFDLLNENHDEWLHPVTGTKHHESFIDLYQDALTLAKSLLDLFADYLEDKTSIDSILELINNQNFETGLDQDYEMKYFKCKYE